MTSCYISRKRLMYAYELIVEQNIDRANKILKEFESVKKLYPAKAEIYMEEEILDFINNNYRLKLCNE